MKYFWSLLIKVGRYKWATSSAIFFQLLTAILTILSIPVVIPFFQILFGMSPSQYSPPDDWYNLEETLNYFFSRLIAMSDRRIALSVVCVTVVVIFFLKNLTRYISNFFMVGLRNRAVRDLRYSLWHTFETMSLSMRNEQKKGHLLTLFGSDLAAVDHSVLTLFELLLRAPLVVIGSLGVMFWLNVKLTLISLGLILFTLLVVGVLSHALKRQALKAQRLLSELTILADEYLSSIKLLRVFNSVGKVRVRFSQLNTDHYRISNKMLRRRELASPLSEFLGVSTVVLLLYCGAQMVFNDEMQPSTFFAFVYAFYNIVDPAKSFARDYANLQKGLASLERIEIFNRQATEVVSHKKVENSVLFRDKIQFKNVSFAYEPGSPILQDLSFTIDYGAKIGIVGYSGSGKTTLADLLLKFYNPDSGNILLDGTDIQDLDAHEYRKLFGTVTQKSVLYHGSIKDNITLWDMDTKDSKLHRICVDVGLDEVLRNKALGIDERIGDEGVLLSGGEGQRVCLARALYHDPQILILDEPTSSLDKKAAHEIVDLILTKIKDITAVLITHNIDLLKTTDKILVINEGRLIDSGTFEELSKRGGMVQNIISG